MNSEINNKILTGLLENKAASYYYFHQRYGIMPGELIIALDYLKKTELINIDANHIVRITTKGKEHLFVNKKSKFTIIDKSWLDIPEYMIAEKKISLDTPYYPDDFDRIFLKKLKTKGSE